MREIEIGDREYQIVLDYMNGRLEAISCRLDEIERSVEKRGFWDEEANTCGIDRRSGGDRRIRVHARREGEDRRK